MSSNPNGTTNEERQNQSAKRVLQLHVGGLAGVTELKVMQMPDGERVFALCFSEKLWTFDQKTGRLARRTNG